MATYTLIETITVGAGGSASATFSTIPSTYKDLVIHVSARASTTSGNSNFFMYMNGVTGSSYAFRRIIATGSSVTTDTQTSQPWIEFASISPNATATYGSNTFSTGEIWIPNYQSSVFKPVYGQYCGPNNGTQYQYIVAGLFSSTSAISSITLDGTDNFVQHSTFSLYGL